MTRLMGSALKFRSPLAINTDGAPNAYHIDGRPGGALNTLCNAGRVFSTEGAYDGHQDCDRFLADVKAAQEDGWHGPTRIVWHGIVTRDKTRHEPVVQESGAYAGYFVSATSLQNKAYKETDQRRYLDARVVPFLVLPKRSAFLGDGGARLGDLAFVIDPETQLYTFAVVGDLGPRNKLGEASIALAAAIKGVPIDPRTVTGRTMRKLVVPHDVVTLVFPGAAVAAPYGPAQIAEAGIAAIQRFGGLDRLKQCAAQR
ncbi:MAG: hypothetical protein JNN33_01385 [Rhodospirillaceae bacterium]|nr:hypothetical protein [Rhodospirillaceae bacterium]